MYRDTIGLNKSPPPLNIYHCGGKALVFFFLSCLYPDLKHTNNFYNVYWFIVDSKILKILYDFWHLMDLMKCSAPQNLHL